MARVESRSWRHTWAEFVFGSFFRQVLRPVFLPPQTTGEMQIHIYYFIIYYFTEHTLSRWATTHKCIPNENIFFFSPACRKRLDIAFLLESGRISSSNFRRTLRFIRKLVVSFPSARVGLVSYSKRSTKVFGFYRYVGVIIWLKSILNSSYWRRLEKKFFCFSIVNWLVSNKNLQR